MGDGTKTDEFLEKFQRGRGGGGSFPIQKFIFQIFAIINGTLGMNSGKNLQYDFDEKAIWNFSKNSSVLVGWGFPYCLVLLPFPIGLSENIFIRLIRNDKRKCQKKTMQCGP